MAAFVEDAREEGADVFQIACPPGCFYPPTLITGVNTASKVVMEEIFGPVLVAMPFRCVLGSFQPYFLMLLSCYHQDR